MNVPTGTSARFGFWAAFALALGLALAAWTGAAITSPDDPVAVPDEAYDAAGGEADAGPSMDSVAPATEVEADQEAYDGGPDDGEEEDAYAQAYAEPAEPAEPRWRVSLTDVDVETRDGWPQVRLTTTGRVSTLYSYLTDPDRMLLKLADTLLTWKPRRLEVGISPLVRIRAAQHDRETWVVLDLDQPVKWNRQYLDDGLLLTLASAPRASAAKAEVAAPVERRPERSRAASAPAAPVRSPAAYRVVDVSVEDLGDRARIVVTTDGPVRYRLERQGRRPELHVSFYDADLAWDGDVRGLPVGALRGVKAERLREDGEPVVRLRVRLSRLMPYTIRKDQNQVVLDIESPEIAERAIPSRGSLRARISVDFQDADLVAVLRALAQDVGYYLVLTPAAASAGGAGDRVTVSIKDQPFESVLDMILRPRGLAYEVTDNTLRVGAAKEFPVETRVFHLKNLDVRRSNLKASLESAFAGAEQTQVVLDEGANRVVVTGLPSDLVRADSILRRMDVQPRLVNRSFSLNYAKAETVAPLVRPALSSQGGLEVNARANALMVSEIPGNMLRLASLIRSLDTKSRQVMIEAWIVEVGLSNVAELGVRWSARSIDARIDPQYTAATSPKTTGATGTLTLGTVQSGVDISATLTALENNGVVNTLSNPRIATLDNEEATLTAAQNIPYTTSIVSNGVVQTVVEYAELPITLSVTPHLTQNDQVLLDPMVLRVTSVVAEGNPPETATRTAETQMLVKNGETLAIGGLIRDEERIQEDKVPLLGDIPLLGFLFRSTNTRTDKVELVVFLTPRILE